MTQLKARASLWWLWAGMHPRFAGTSERLSHLPAFENPAFHFRVSDELLIPQQGDVYGHDVVNDWGMGSPLFHDKVPVSPLYARDLAGRTVYIGNRIYCHDTAWENGLRALTPSHARDVELDGMQGADLLENVFLLQWRVLEPSIADSLLMSGDTNTLIPIYYDRHNLYPYKVRLDTFYGDGWRLPQLQHLHVVRGVDLREAENHGAELLRRWQSRPEGQAYAEFIEAMGAEFVEAGYHKGCTLIPTFEACNGYNKVSAAFELEDYWSGRAVPDLHQIVETRADSAPSGTILDVIQPGFALENRIEKAKVVVSDGTQYKTPHADNPEAMVPDIRLPHTRSIAEWGATWIPTHPAHFEAPAIWGWDEQTGFFTQMSGPLWDPLHYYYASVPKVLAAERTGRLRDNPALIRVPDEMRLRFYPVVPMQGFDFFDVDQLVARAESEDPFPIMSRYHDVGRDVCDVGYHPLPLFYEHELNNWWFPELMPQKRMKGDVIPFLYESRIVPTVVPQISPIEYGNMLVGDENAPWITDNSLLAMPEADPLKIYPQLKRYGGDISDQEIRDLVPVYLENLPDEVLNAMPDVLWNGYDAFEDMELLADGLYVELQELRDKSLKLMRLRHRIYRQNRNLYLRAYWEGTPPQELENQFFEADSGSQGKKALPSAAFSAPPVIANE